MERLSLDGRCGLAQGTAMRGHHYAVAVALLCVGSVAAADEQPICATRPGKSTAPCTVPAGHFQVETGLADWSLQKAGSERDTSLVVGETVFKYGLTDRSDIEVDVTPWERATSRGPGFHARRHRCHLQARADAARRAGDGRADARRQDPHCQTFAGQWKMGSRPAGPDPVQHRQVALHH